MTKTNRSSRNLKIAYIAAGAAGMYCGSCIRDNTLAKAMIAQGHEVALVPTYTPIRTDDDGVSIDRVFFNGINVYLQQKIPLLRNKGAWVDKLFDNKTVLNRLAKMNASTNAKDLGELTISMLNAEEGNQRRELDKLIDWLKNDYKPEIVKITNSMLVGLARKIKESLDIPVLCALQGEDIFLDDLESPYREKAMATLKARAKDADGFIATSKFYVDYMADYLDIPKEKIHPVRIGINMEGHGAEKPPLPASPFTIGYLARICPEKGLHLLVEAFRRLVEKTGKDAVRLRIAGYLGARDEAYFQEIMQNIESWGLSGSVDVLGEVSREEKIDLLNSLHVFSVPTIYQEPKGLFLLEALANGVPVVQPNHGAFPEILNDTNGGVLVTPNSPEALVDTFLELMNAPERAAKLGAKGKTAVHKNYTHHAMANETLEIFHQYLKK